MSAPESPDWSNKRPGMLRLLALIASPPGNLRPFIRFPAALVFSYTALLQGEAYLSGIGVSPFVLSVVIAMGFVAGMNAPGQVRAGLHDAEVARSAYAIFLGILGVLLVVHDPLWCQRVFTVFAASKALFILHALWRAPGDLPRLGGPVDGPAWFAGSWARWKVVSLVMLVLINETAIRYGTLTEWIIVWSVTPVVVYCLMCWTIVATWDEDGDAG